LEKESQERIQLSENASTLELVKSLYKDDEGRPFKMVPTQNEIFDCIFKKQSPDGKRRIHIETTTQYGKSDVVSMAVLTRAATFPEKWAIVAPSQSKARIIMGYISKHLFENEYTLSRFKITEGESVERIRRERSKSRLTFDVGNNQVGEIFILSAESRLRTEDVGNALMGFGAPNLVEDEAALISDESDAKAMRMVGGFTPFNTDFVVKIGNPFTRGHFLKSFMDPRYHNLVVDWKKGVKEGRLRRSYVEEMREKPFFRVLYECKFPEADEIDIKGWTQLLSEEEISLALYKGEEPIKHIGEKRLGNDIARGGGNLTAWVVRSMNYAEKIATSKQNNLIEIAAQTSHFMTETKILPGNTFIDDVGVGGGVVDSLFKENKKINGINVGKRATAVMKFYNIRAEAYWRLREWIKKGGKLSNSDDWYQLTEIKYKPDSKGRLRMMSKDDMRARGIDSPDVADALMLTFVRSDHADVDARKRMRRTRRTKRTAGRGLSVTMGGY